MKTCLRQKNKLYECLDSTILYQIDSCQISFLIGEKAARKIVVWEDGTSYSADERECLQLGTGIDESFSYDIGFCVSRDGVDLSIKIPMGYTFRGHFQGQESQNIAYLKATDCPRKLTRPELIILNIVGQTYQELAI